MFLRIGAFVLGLAIVGASPRALAYTVESAATEGCHERITSEALRRVREENDAAAPMASDDDDRALIEDLQFTPDDDMRDIGAVALLLGVRDNDLKGRGADDLSSLAIVHGDPRAQDEHCLRDIDHDEPGGPERAIAACRAYIEDRVARAIVGLDADGRPHGRTRLAIHLAIRGDVEAPLPIFYLRMGQALHALEDGFSHTYRTRDGRTVTVALNWLDVVGGEHVESRDGPPHSDLLDACDDADELRTLRRELATDAATELLAAALAPDRSPEEKMVEVRAVLDRYLGYQPGCTAADGWCDAPEERIEASGCGCAVVGDDRSTGGLAVATFAGAVALLRRRSTRRSARARRAAVALGVMLALAAPSSDAEAQGEPVPAAPPSAAPPPAPSGPAPGTTPPTDPTVTTTVTPSGASDVPPTTAVQVTTPGTATTPGTVTTTVTAPATADEKAPPPPNIVPVEEPGPQNPNATAWGLALTGAGSVDKTGLAVALGGRVRVTSDWAFGLDGEWNPWLSLTGGEVLRSGAANVYASAYWRVPLAYESFNIRSSLSLGTSILLFDLYGAPSGSVGLFVGANPLGIEYKASDAFYLVVNPIGIAIPIPQISGLPFLYPQYRLSIALEFYAG